MYSTLLRCQRLLIVTSVAIGAQFAHAEYRVAVNRLNAGVQSLSPLASTPAPAPIYEMTPTNLGPKSLFISTLTYSIVVINTSTGAIIPNATITLTAPVGRAYSGGHDHDDAARPTGSLTYLTGNTGPSGQDFAPIFTAPEVSGVVDIVGNCSAPGITCLQDTPLPIAVRVPNLVELGPGTSYLLTGSFGSPGVTSQHTQNHFAVSSFVSKLQALGDNYFMYFAGQPNPRLLINDLSLPEGGRFDIFNNWRSSHQEHRTGISGDIGLVAPQRRSVLKILLLLSGVTGVTYLEPSHWHIREFGSAQ